MVGHTELQIESIFIALVCRRLRAVIHAAMLSWQQRHILKHGFPPTPRDYAPAYATFTFLDACFLTETRLHFSALALADPDSKLSHLIWKQISSSQARERHIAALKVLFKTHTLGPNINTRLAGYGMTKFALNALLKVGPLKLVRRLFLESLSGTSNAALDRQQHERLMVDLAGRHGRTDVLECLLHRDASVAKAFDFHNGLVQDLVELSRPCDTADVLHGKAGAVNPGFANRTIAGLTKLLLVRAVVAGAANGHGHMLDWLFATILARERMLCLQHGKRARLPHRVFGPGVFLDFHHKNKSYVAVNLLFQSFRAAADHDQIGVLAVLWSHLTARLPSIPYEQQNEGSDLLTVFSAFWYAALTMETPSGKVFAFLIDATRRLNEVLQACASVHVNKNQTDIEFAIDVSNWSVDGPTIVQVARIVHHFTELTLSKLVADLWYAEGNGYGLDNFLHRLLLEAVGKSGFRELVLRETKASVECEGFTTSKVGFFWGLEGWSEEDAAPRTFADCTMPMGHCLLEQATGWWHVQHDAAIKAFWENIDNVHTSAFRKKNVYDHVLHGDGLTRLWMPLGCTLPKLPEETFLTLTSVVVDSTVAERAAHTIACWRLYLEQNETKLEILIDKFFLRAVVASAVLLLPFLSAEIEANAKRRARVGHVLLSALKLHVWERARKPMIIDVPFLALVQWIDQLGCVFDRQTVGEMLTLMKLTEAFKHSPQCIHITEWSLSHSLSHLSSRSSLSSSSAASSLVPSLGAGEFVGETFAPRPGEDGYHILCKW